MQRDQLKKLNLPDTPGVYIFRGPKRKILYVGKATSLRDRVRSYFGSDIATTRSSAIAGMVDEAITLTYEETGSVLEALILEANLIKQHQPPYNTRDKDNKSYNYLVLTKEDFPRILVVRGRELFQNWQGGEVGQLFGPYPEGGSLKEAIKIVRKIFPYRDTCTPCTVGKQCRPCFNRQLGLCPGVCSGEITKKDYALTVTYIKQLFSGNFKGLKRQLAKDMAIAAKAEAFEQANKLRKQVAALDHIRDVSLIKDDSRVSSGGGARIEAFDTAHTGGSETVAVMTVVNNGVLIKNAYRKFKIQTATNDDVASLKEVLTRRLGHPEWTLPRVFVVDGGVAQLRAAERVLKAAGVHVPLVGVVKNDKHKPERLIGDAQSIKAYERDILLANAEAHRFAISWHRLRTRKRLTFDS